MNDSPSGFTPLVPANEIQPELTVRALLLGALLGIVFGAASTYLALRVGLTVSASVPIAVSPPSADHSSFTPPKA